MTLEDFFTPTEMKNGLTAFARVKELVSVMQNNRDSIVRNPREATRQWSTVADTLAATENQGSLDHFILLDGIYFLDRWLQEAQNCSNDTSDNSVEGSINAMLGALEKLPIDNERSVSSGIGVTVKNLCGHKSFRVQERARALLDSWKQGKHDVANRRDNDGVKPTDATVTVESGCLEHSADDITPVNGSADEDNHVRKPVGSECKHLTSSDGSRSESIKDVKIPISDTQDHHNTTLSRVDKEDGYRENAQGSSSVSSLCQESLSRMNESPLLPVDGKVDGSFLDVPELKDFTNDEKETDKIKVTLDKFDENKICSVSTTSGPELDSSADPPNAQHCMMQTVLSDVDAKEKTPPDGLDDDMSTLDSEPKSGVVCCGLPKPSSPEEMETSFSKKEDVKEHTSGSMSEAKIDTKVSEINECRSDMELEYGIVDALEIARQVAIEVEQEVVDYRKQFSNSSSEKISGGVVQPGSPDSINKERDQAEAEQQNETPRKQYLSIGPPSPSGEDHLIGSLNTDVPEDCMHDTVLSQVTEAVIEPDYKTNKGLYDFDLNEEVCSKKMDHPRTPHSVPITVVSASKAAAPRFSASPLHFGGERGWKGSAATSAFRPASFRRTPDGEKTHSVEGSIQSSKQRQDFLYIDLNVAEGNGDGATNPIRAAKQIPTSSGLPSGESSIEVSSRRAERLVFDLNCAIDNEDAPSLDCGMEERLLCRHKNGCQSPASSSPSRQPSMMNVDLNGSPSFFDDSNDQPGLGQYSSLDQNTCGGFKLDDPVVSILGARVMVNRKEFIPQTRPFLPNGQFTESPIHANFARSVDTIGMQPMMAYAPPSPSVFGYNSLSAASMPLSQAIHGPQMTGSPAAVPLSSQHQFLMRMIGPLSGSNQVGTTRPSLDLNTGLTVEAESREPGGLRQLYIPGQAMLMEDQIRCTSQPLNSGMEVKRKEPDGGWDMYPYGFKHRPSWH